MIEGLFVAFEFEVLFSDMKMSLHQFEIGFLVGQHQYLAIGELLHAKSNDGLEVFAIILLDVLNYLLQLRLDVFTKHLIGTELPLLLDLFSSYYYASRMMTPACSSG